MEKLPTLHIGAVQRFCLQDGPGIRTTVFLQGCSMRCWWCHNAHLQAYRSDKAREVHIDDLVQELERDARYWIRSGGGITLSGGEPLFQAKNSAVLFSQMRKKGYHCSVETAGAASLSEVMLLNEHVDLWLFDLKTLNVQLFQEATGGDLNQVLSNLQELLRVCANTVWLRIPVVKDFNDDDRTLNDMRKFIEEQDGIGRVQLLPGHDLCASPKRSAAVDKATCNKAKEILELAHSCVEICW